MTGTPPVVPNPIPRQRPVAPVASVPSLRAQLEEHLGNTKNFTRSTMEDDAIFETVVKADYASAGKVADAARAIFANYNINGAKALVSHPSKDEDPYVRIQLNLEEFRALRDNLAQKGHAI
jgi:hypothetical protein